MANNHHGMNISDISTTSTISTLENSSTKSRQIPEKSFISSPEKENIRSMCLFFDTLINIHAVQRHTECRDFVTGETQLFV